MVERASKGEEIVIRKGRLRAKLERIPIPRRKPGREKIAIADDFDAPLPKRVLDEFYK